MVVAEQNNWISDVVLVIEATATLSPYIESLKTNYIVPTLEYFSGGPPEDRDCGSDVNSTLFSLVTFMAADCAPDTASQCFGYTANTHKFLSWLDRIMFIGGAGECHSHVAEGLSTALQVFDDFQSLRGSNVTTQKYCILICNSPPYPLPALESVSYSGFVSEQLASLMAERQINFSILCPRKIPVLFKLYEEAGGDLQHALGKHYAKDRRHLVLLRGFQLQERPVTPPPMDTKPPLVASSSVCSPPAKRASTNSPPHPREATGFKQPATQGNYPGLDWSSTENASGNMASQNQVQTNLQAPVSGQSPLGYGQNPLQGQPNQPLPPRPNIPTPPSHLSSLNQPNPPNVTITNKGPQGTGIPGGPRMNWNQVGAPSSAASTPPTTSVLATQLSMAPSNMPLRHNSQLQQNQSAMVSQAQASINASQNVLNQGSGGLRGNLPNLSLRMSSSSPGPGPNAGSNSLVQLNQHPNYGQNAPSAQPQQSVSMASSIVSTMPAKLGGTNTMPQGQTMTTVSSSNMAQQSVPGVMPMSQGPSQQGQQPVGPPKDRRSIWQGVIEFQEKPSNAQPQGQRITHSLSCYFTAMPITGETDINAEKWPNRLMLQLLPRQLIVMANLFNTLKTASRHVLIHFSQESEALQKLCQMMSSGWVGCIQFPTMCDIRIMIILYMPDKRIYMGFIAHDQENFLVAVRQIYENHRKQQQQKQRLQQLSGNNIPTSEGMVLSSNTPNQNVMINQPAAPNMSGNSNQMGSRMPIGQQQVVQNTPQPQTTAPNAGMVHSRNMNQAQQALTQQQASNARLSELEAARQQNLMKIQQLQQTLEAAQQKELQFKAAQEQQQQQQQQQQVMIDKQNAIRNLQQQLHQHQQQLVQQQQNIQMQQQLNQQNSHNPQLRNLLQQQAQQMRRQQQQQQQHQMLMQQHSQGIRPQMSGSIPQGAMGSNVGQQQPQQQPQQQAWNDSGILDLLPP